jgi:uncharacterized membrane protein (DUF2068 family)
MTDSARPSSPPRHHNHNRWLVLIALFKLAQALLFVAIAAGALQLLHTLHILHVDLADLLSDLVDRLNVNPESKLVNFVLDHATFIDEKMLRRVGAAGFIYAALDLLEGTGLYLEKVWAEYLTLVITGSFLPLEIWEVVHNHSLTGTLLFGLNLLVFLYLLLMVANNRRRRHGLPPLF